MFIVNSGEWITKIQQYPSNCLQLYKLRDDLNPDDELKKLPIPCVDEARILLFARADREKEDW